MNPLLQEPIWTPSSQGTGTVYNRPVLGSELWFDQYSQLWDGYMNCCMGFAFTSSLSLSKLEIRAQDAMARLRFSCPTIAATLRKGVHDPDFRTWFYSPAQHAQEVREWASTVVVAHPDRFDPDDFIVHAGLLRLPYIVDGREQLLRCYIFRTPETENEYGLFLHGTHAIMDGHPTLNAMSLMFEWMTVSNPEPLETLEWGTEWKNLPVGPIAATGGPRSNWETEGLGLLQQTADVYATMAKTHSLKCQFREVKTAGKVIRLHAEIGEEETAKLLAACKSAGFTATNLFEAATVLATFKCNPTPDETAYMTLPNVISLGKWLVPPYNQKTHFISSLIMAQMKTDCHLITAKTTPKDRILAVMRSFKDQYTAYMNNPHLPHMMVAQLAFSPMREIETLSNPRAVLLTNLGLIEHSTPAQYYPDSDRSQVPLYDLVKFFVGQRLDQERPVMHVWTMRSKINVLCQVNEAWDPSYVKGFLDEVVRQAKILLD